MLIGDLLQPHAERMETANELVERIRTVLADRDLAAIDCSVPFKPKKPITRPERFVIDAAMLLPASELELEAQTTEEIALDPAALGSAPPPPPSVPVADEATLVKAPSFATTVDEPAAPPAAALPTRPGFGKTLPLETPPLIPRAPAASAPAAPASDPIESVSSINVARGVSHGGAPTPAAGYSEPPPAFGARKRAIALVVGGLTALGAAAIAVIVLVKSGASSDEAASSSVAGRPAPAASLAPPAASATVLVSPEVSGSAPLSSVSARPSASGAPKPTTKPINKPGQPVDPLNAKGSGIFGGRR